MRADMNGKKSFIKRIIGSRFFHRAREQAVELTKNPERLNSLLQKADEKAQLRKKGSARGCVGFFHDTV